MPGTSQMEINLTKDKYFALKCTIQVPSTVKDVHCLDNAMHSSWCKVHSVHQGGAYGGCHTCTISAFYYPEWPLSAKAIFGAVVIHGAKNVPLWFSLPQKIGCQGKWRPPCGPLTFSATRDRHPSYGSQSHGGLQPCSMHAWSTAANC